MKDTILERGRFIRTCKEPERLAFFQQNKPLVVDLFSKYRMEMIIEHRDNQEWVCIGRKGQIFEYGIRKLGISVEGRLWTNSFIQKTKDFTTVKQKGDGEANLFCEWTPENVEKLAKLLGLFKRRTYSTSGMS